MFTYTVVSAVLCMLSVVPDLFLGCCPGTCGEKMNEGEQRMTLSISTLQSAILYITFDITLALQRGIRGTVMCCICLI